MCVSCYDEVKSFNSFKSKCQDLNQGRCVADLEVRPHESVAVDSSSSGFDRNVDSRQLLLHQECSQEEEASLLLVPADNDLNQLEESIHLNITYEEDQKPTIDDSKELTLLPSPPKKRQRAAKPAVKSSMRRRNNPAARPSSPPVVLSLNSNEPEEYIIREYTVGSSEEIVGELVAIEDTHKPEQSTAVGNNQDALECIEIIEGNTKRYKCPKCDKVCKQKGQLRSHQRTHTLEKPYACNYCEKSFSENGNLKQHIRSLHLDLRPFVCEKCQKGFKTHYSHRVHVRSCVTHEKPYECADCSKTFISSGKLLLHRRKHTGERVSETLFLLTLNSPFILHLKVYIRYKHE